MRCTTAAMSLLRFAMAEWAFQKTSWKPYSIHFSGSRHRVHGMPAVQGLGLTIARNIAENHRALLELSNHHRGRS